MHEAYCLAVAVAKKEHWVARYNARVADNAEKPPRSVTDAEV